MNDEVGVRSMYQLVKYGHTFYIELFYWCSYLYGDQLEMFGLSNSQIGLMQTISFQATVRGVPGSNWLFTYMQVLRGAK